MDDVLVAVARNALQLSYPEEVDEVEAALGRFQLNGTGRVKPPVGMGIELLPLADQLLPVLAVLFGIASERAAQHAVDVISERTKTALGQLRDKPDRTAEPLDPAQEREVFETVVKALNGLVTAEEAEKLGHGVIGALRLRSRDQG